MVPDYKGTRDLLSRTCCMVRDFLLEKVYHDALPEDLADEWGTTYRHVKNILKDDMLPAELLTVLQFSGLEFGVTIRDPGSGKEVTFFAANNLVEDDDVPQVIEETIVYDGSDKKGEKGGEGIPDTIPRVHTVINGSYNIEDEKPARNPFEDPEGVIDAEFSETTQRDIEELSNLCENCYEGERLPDSMLCHPCTEAGVICNPPDDSSEEEVDPLELIASVHARAEQARQQSDHLLALASGLKDPEDEEEEEEEDDDDEEEERPSKKDRMAEEEEEEPSWARPKPQGLQKCGVRLHSLKHLDDEEDFDDEDLDLSEDSFLEDEMDRYAPEVRAFFDFSDLEEEEEEVLSARQRELSIDEEE